MDAKLINDGVRVECSAKFSTAEFYINPRGNFTISFWHEDKKDFVSLVFSPEEIENFIDTFRMFNDKANAHVNVCEADRIAKRIDEGSEGVEMENMAAADFSIYTYRMDNMGIWFKDELIKTGLKNGKIAKEYGLKVLSDNPSYDCLLICDGDEKIGWIHKNLDGISGYFWRDAKYGTISKLGGEDGA